ncbi:cytochrome b/b6 domain-containing protein [Quisquiliibacterium transsilvanicum]|uniref:Cytochrome b n=1 Tax=Quisquiliibacterium transsilvanicum TaxID=1549638 RepID=A0A7W8HIT0_9BURK|nr:cytochrome b/b6 domain-containing protein [Quisquiliibacterium transsilvanicum]MBB5272703.1 cytochrome b [Quisquiliibacterium transsilvanicum]
MIPDTLAGNAASGMKQGPAPVRPVIGLPMRIFHWALALSFTGAWLTAEADGLREVHTVLGYTMAGLLAFRLVYGLVGPKRARLSALHARAAGLPRWLRATWQTVKSLGRPGTPDAPRVNWSQGLGVATGAILAAMLALIAPLVLSGLATLDEWGGHRVAELTEELHEFSGSLLLGLVLSHLALLAVLSVLRRRNEAAPMITGRLPVGTRPRIH